jgi:hypothetical protein
MDYLSVKTEPISIKFNQLYWNCHRAVLIKRIQQINRLLNFALNVFLIAVRLLLQLGNWGTHRKRMHVTKYYTRP